MNEENETKASSGEPATYNQPELTSELVSPPLDDFFQSLVSLANRGVEFGVTLTVGGFLISGTLVGGKRYFDEHLPAAIIAEGADEEFRESMQGFFRSFGEIYDSDIPTVGTNPEPPPLPIFLHLRDAKFFHHSGKPIPANQSIWWRGRISEIQGFHIGLLSHMEQR